MAYVQGWQRETASTDWWKTTATSGTVTVGTPSATSGNLLIGVFVLRAGSVYTFDAAPAGWTEVQRLKTNVNVIVCSREASGTSADNFTMAWTNDGTGADTRLWYGAVAEFTGVNIVAGVPELHRIGTNSANAASTNTNKSGGSCSASIVTAAGQAISILAVADEITAGISVSAGFTSKYMTDFSAIGLGTEYFPQVGFATLDNDGNGTGAQTNEWTWTDNTPATNGAVSVLLTYGNTGGTVPDWSYDGTGANGLDAAGLGGPAGSSGAASTVTADSSGGTYELIGTAVTAASAEHTTRWFLKKGSPFVGSVDITLDYDGTPTWNTVANGSIGTNSFTQHIFSKTVANPRIALRFSNANDKIIVGNAELHLNTAAADLQGASHIYTVESAVTAQLSTDYTYGAVVTPDVTSAWTAIPDNSRYYPMTEGGTSTVMTQTGPSAEGDGEYSTGTGGAWGASAGWELAAPGVVDNVVTLESAVSTLSTRSLVAGEPTGIDPATATTMSFVYGAGATGTFTLTPVGATVDIWIAGVKYPLSGAQVVAVTKTTGLWFIYYSAPGGVGQWNCSQTPWTIGSTQAPVAAVYINTTLGAGLLCDERHGISMDWATHARLHAVDGSQISSGGTLAGFVVSGTAANSDPAASDVQVTVAQTTLRDEDIVLSLSALTAGSYFVPNRTGTGSTWTWGTKTVPYLASDLTVSPGTNIGFIQYNRLNGSTWELTNLATGQFVNYYVFATDIVDPVLARFIFVPGQAVHADLTSAQAESVLSLNLSGFPTGEFAPLYQITYRCSTNANYNDMIGRCAIASNPVRLVGFTSSVSSTVSPSSHNALSNRSDADSHPATAVSFTPAGNIAATTVQAAIAELDTEKAPLTLVDSGDLYTATTVEGALAEVMADVNAITPITDIDSLSAASTPTGVEKLVGLQSSTAVTATVQQVAGSPATDMMAHAKDRVRFFSHLMQTPKDYDNTTTGTLFGIEPFECFNGGTTGAKVSQESDSILRYGVASLATGTNSAGYAALISTVSPIYFVTAGSSFDIRFLVLVSALPDGTNTFTVEIGLVTAPTAVATTGIFFRLTSASGNWHMVTKASAGSETSTTTSTAATVGSIFGTYQTLRITYTSAGANFYINNTLINGSPITATLPPNNTALFCGAVIRKSASTTSRSLYVDAISLDFNTTDGAGTYFA